MFRPTVIARIPSDIATSQHADIHARIATINADITAVHPTRNAAERAAAVTIAHSGIGQAVCYGSAIEVR